MGMRTLGSIEGLTDGEREVLSALIGALRGEPGTSDVDAGRLAEITVRPVKSVKGFVGSLTRKGYATSFVVEGSASPTIYLAEEHYDLHPTWNPSATDEDGVPDRVYQEEMGPAPWERELAGGQLSLDASGSDAAQPGEAGGTGAPSSAPLTREAAIGLIERCEALCAAEGMTLAVVLKLARAKAPLAPKAPRSSAAPDLQAAKRKVTHFRYHLGKAQEAGDEGVVARLQARLAEAEAAVAAFEAGTPPPPAPEVPAAAAPATPRAPKADKPAPRTAEPADDFADVAPAPEEAPKKGSRTRAVKTYGA